ncbi:MAG: M1 family aminopeptidase [Bacteroidota bacterium]
MVNFRVLLLVLISLLVSCVASKRIVNPQIETGVSKSLAVYRKSLISDINYRLTFTIPAGKNEPIPATEVLTFNLAATKFPLQIDFKEVGSKLKSIEVNGKAVPVSHQFEHILVDPKFLSTGKNEVKIAFIAGDGALNRNADYLYTLFVPDRARTVFPCFDQPDLKATYTLSLDLPAKWSAMANANLNDSLSSATRKVYNYKTSDTLSTYLFAFVAGKFNRAKGTTGKFPTDFLYRETDTAKILGSVKEVFRLHDNALNYLETWTGIPYPFQKFGFVAIPDFQFGGMEHAGNIQYKSSALFLDGGATKDQFNSRSNVISHETAHMWFGDLVTMNWFTDVWMKEVFANFMADKSTEAITGKDVFDLKFLVDHFPLAYGVDRTTGANPIRQDLENLKDAGTMYGNIIYHKAPIMMRQLEKLMGKDKFQEGVRVYLNKFRNSNASWPDLIGILDDYTAEDLQKWNKVWVNQTGRPVITYSMHTENGKITKFIIHQRPEFGSSRIWPQLFDITLFSLDGQKNLSVNLNAREVELKSAIGMPAPSSLLFNSSGEGYGVWPVDSALFATLYSISKPLNRASAYISIYENALTGRSVKPIEALKLFMNGLSVEKEELNLKLLTNYITNLYWGFLDVKVRESFSSGLEAELWIAMVKSEFANNKKLLFKAYQDIYQSTEGRNRLYEIWSKQLAPAGLKLTEDDFTSLAFSLALRDDQDSGILSKQLSRISNADRKARFEFIMPALSSNVGDRDKFFNSLASKNNRQKEANVATALTYLHHPLRQQTSLKYLAESLSMLQEIQTTGDIFFPQNWLQSIFGTYQQKEAADVVRRFLSENPAYNPKLKAKILQTADNLLKAEKLINH